MSRQSRPQRLAVAAALPENLYDYARPPTRRAGRPSRDVSTRWTVKDDWPERVPVTEAEIEVFEAWFGELFGVLFGARPSTRRSP
jgi:hypothetical protein